MIVIKTLVISSQPYAQWLAESLSFLENRKIDKIAIVAIDKTNGEVITGYHDCTFADKAVMAANIQADAIYGSVLALSLIHILHKWHEMGTDSCKTKL